MKKTISKSTWMTLLCTAALLALVVLLENVLDPNKNIMVFTALKKGAVYALVAVSMNLLNGFTGLFSLGQAGFMLLGAYTYAILTIPVSQRDAVYYIYNGSAINFSLPELFGGGAFGLGLGVVAALILGGCVAAAVLSAGGTIYTGVCIDTCSTLGICAERNAIFNMITNGEHEIEKVLAVMPDGRTGPPCGACRELMVQLMPRSYRRIEIMLDYENRRTVSLGELTPQWWI